MAQNSLAGYREGQRFDVNGAVYVYRNGQFELEGSQTPSMQTRPADPQQPYDVERARNQAAASATDPARAAADLEGQRLQNEAARLGLENTRLQTQNTARGTRQRAATIESLEGQLDRIQEIYDEHFRGSGVGSIVEY